VPSGHLQLFQINANVLLLLLLLLLIITWPRVLAPASNNHWPSKTSAAFVCRKENAIPIAIGISHAVTKASISDFHAPCENLSLGWYKQLLTVCSKLADPTSHFF